MKTVWYIDDDNIRHFTVIHSEGEFNFLKDRFEFVGLITDFARQGV